MSDMHLEKLFTQYAQSNSATEEMLRNINPMNPDEQIELFKMNLQNHLIGNALGGALTSRHGLLKKVISEIR
jgi:hypothetical protein